jgi:hypothetical protein
MGDLLRAGALASVFVVAACGGAPAAPPKMVSFRFKGGPPNATVTIDDLAVGPLEMVTRRGIALPAGTHRISVEAPGYFPWDKLVQTPESSAQEPVKLEVNLIPVPE